MMIMLCEQDMELELGNLKQQHNKHRKYAGPSKIDRYHTLDSTIITETGAAVCGTVRGRCGWACIKDSRPSPFAAYAVSPVPGACGTHPTAWARCRCAAWTHRRALRPPRCSTHRAVPSSTHTDRDHYAFCANGIRDTLVGFTNSNNVTYLIRSKPLLQVECCSV